MHGCHREMALVGNLCHYARDISRLCGASQTLYSCLFRTSSKKANGTSSHPANGHQQNTNSGTHDAPDLLDVTDAWPVFGQKYPGKTFHMGKKRKSEERYNYGLPGLGKASYPR